MAAMSGAWGVARSKRHANYMKCAGSLKVAEGQLNHLLSVATGPS